MTRRSFFSSLAAMGLAASAACNGGGSELDHDAAMPDANAWSDASRPADASLSDASALTDGQIVAIIDAANLGEIQQCFLATGPSGIDGGVDAGFDAGTARSTNGAVLSFADMMIADHSQSDETVGALGISPVSSAAQAMIQSSANAAMAQLAPLAGRAFDLAYARAQIAFDQSWLDVVQHQLIGAGQSAPLKAYVEGTLVGAVQNHLTAAQSVLAFLSMEYEAGAGGGLSDAPSE